MIGAPQSGVRTMPARVNLDALIFREDFEVIISNGEAPFKHSMEIFELERNQFFYAALRKPDFQRETSEWSANIVVGLIRSFIEGELIPGVILWKHGELTFVIDGSHRLSALIAWVQDDYGDGDLSRQFFDHTIPDEQIKLAKRTRELVEKEFGSYRDHKDAIGNPDSYGPDLVARARGFSSRSLQLQWVRGDSAKAEDSFVRINQRAATINAQELELIKSRNKPNAIGARAIIRRGTGHQYWSNFGDNEQDAIREFATEIHTMMFEPNLSYPIKSLDLPAGGIVYSGPSLRMIYDFINLCVGATSSEDDETGRRTIDYLKRCRKVMRLVVSNHVSSLGLHPAVYFYSWTGKHQPILFLTITALVVEYEKTNTLPAFTEHREGFESFLMANRPLLNQLLRKFGTKASGTKHLIDFYRKILELLSGGLQSDAIVQELQADSAYSYLQPGESPYDGVAPTRFSTQVRSGLIMRDLLPTAPRCMICHGVIPTQAISVDHKIRVENGGLAIPDNAQLAHPYCNSGYKEWLHSQNVKKGAV